MMDTPIYVPSTPPQSEKSPPLNALDNTKALFLCHNRPFRVYDIFKTFFLPRKKKKKKKKKKRPKHKEHIEDTPPTRDFETNKTKKKKKTTEKKKGLSLPSEEDVIFFRVVVLF